MLKDQEYYLPKYYKISQEIISKIRNGELSPGMKIPSENEIIKAYKVSNTTARKILMELENAGLVMKVKGKGTFVKIRGVERSVTRILGFTKNMIEAGYSPSTKLLDIQMLPQGYSDIINGRQYTMNVPVCKIKRLRYANQIPMMLEVRYISTVLCPDIERKDLEKPLYDIYEKDYGLKLREVNQMISAIIIKDEQTKNFFNIVEPTPAFVVRGVTFVGREIILEMEMSIYRGDKYTFSVRAT